MTLYQELLDKSSETIQYYKHLAGPFSEPKPLLAPKKGTPKEQPQIQSKKSQSPQQQSPPKAQQKPSPTESAKKVNAQRTIEPKKPEPSKLNPANIADHSAVEIDSDSEDVFDCSFEESQYHTAISPFGRALLKPNNEIILISKEGSEIMYIPSTSEVDDIVIVDGYLIASCDTGYFITEINESESIRKWDKIERNLPRAKKMKADPLNPHAFFLYSEHTQKIIVVNLYQNDFESVTYKNEKNVIDFDVSSKYVVILKKNSIKCYERDDLGTTPYFILNDTSYDHIYCNNECMFLLTGSTVIIKSIVPVPTYVGTIENALNIWSSESVIVCDGSGTLHIDYYMKKKYDYRIVCAAYAAGLSEGLCFWPEQNLQHPILEQDSPQSNTSEEIINPSIIDALLNKTNEYVTKYFSEQQQRAKSVKDNLQRKMNELEKKSQGITDQVTQLQSHGNTPEAVKTLFHSGKYTQAVRLACENSYQHIQIIAQDLPKVLDVIPQALLLALTERLFCSVTSHPQAVVPLLYQVMVSLSPDDALVRSIMASRADAMQQTILELFQSTAADASYLKDIKRITHIVISYHQ